MNFPPQETFFFDWSFPLAFLWGLIILVSFVGWGRAIGSWLIKPERETPDEGWGSAAAWGMSAFLVFSGPMMLLSIFSTAFLTLFLAAGLALAVWQARHGWGVKLHIELPTFRWRFISVLLLFLIGLTYAGAVASRRYNENDDFAAYFAFSKMLLDTGTLIDPFNFRMMGALGGQPALVTLIVAYFPWKYANMMDMGIAVLIIVGLTMELVRSSDAKSLIARFLLVAIALTFSMPRMNTASQLTGVVLFMALLRTFDLVANGRPKGWRAALLLGGTMTAVSTLRTHNFFAAGMLGAAFVAWRFWQEKRARGMVVRDTLKLLAVTVAFLAPWWVVAYRSCGVFLYPLIKGTQRPEFETFNLHLSFFETIQFVGGFFLANNYFFMFLPACLLSPGPVRSRFLLLGGALFLISVAFVSQFTYGSYYDLYRYLIPIGLAFGLHTAGILAREAVASTRDENESLNRLRRKFLVTMAALFLFFQSFDFAARTLYNVALIWYAFDGRNQLTSLWIPVSTEEAERDYQEALTQIPSGSKVLVAVDYPYLFDYSNHCIYSVDVAGAASPAPGLPYFKGAEPVRNYLLAQGIDYIAFAPFEKAFFLHSRAHQAWDLSHNVQMWRFYATYELDFINNIDELTKSSQILYDSPTIRVIDLKE